MKRAGVWLAAVYLLCAIGLAIALRAGDRWWPATLLLFGPRWIWLVPAPFVLVCALLVKGRASLRRAALAVGFAGGGVVLVWVMDLRAPWRALLRPAAEGPPLRVTTLNAGAEWLEPPSAVAALFEGTDVLAVEECGMGSFEALGQPAGWSVRRDKMICVFSRFPIELEDELYVEGVDGGAARYRVAAPGGPPLTLVALHLESPRDGLEAVRAGLWRGVPALNEVMAIRDRQSAAIKAWVQKAAPEGALVVAGDFNMPTESAILREDWGWLGNAFELAGWGFGSSKRTRLIRVRIDHLFVGAGLAVERCTTGPHVGSDHLPMTATLRRAVSR